MNSKPLILAPAGNFACLRAALNSGADAVYFGAGTLNMRAGAALNFTVDDLPEVVRQCHECGVQAFLTVNTIVYDPELPALRELCQKAKEAGVDACIAGDPAVLGILKSLNIPVHLTVQCNITNLESVRFYAQWADVMVMARELPLEGIRRIAEGIKRDRICGPSGNLVRIEAFVHGALCVAVSGKCYMSLALYGESANRGRCLQPCRRRYLVTDAENGNELVIDNEYVMSPRDLCTLAELDRILDSGISVLKIEGRARAADYVATVVSAYRDARDAWLAGTFSVEKARRRVEKLREVFNRGFWEGGHYLNGDGNAWSACKGSIASLRKEQVGRVQDYYAKPCVCALKIDAGLTLKQGDRLLITGNKTGAVEIVLSELRVNDVPVPEAKQGDIVSFVTENRVRTGDLVQKLIPVRH